MRWSSIAHLDAVILNLIVEYPDTYPDVIPELSFETTDEENGELTDAENAHVLGKLRDVVSDPSSLSGHRLCQRAQMSTAKWHP